MRRYFRMPVFFLALFTSVQDKDGSSNLYKAIIDEYKTYALYPSDDIIKRKQYEIVLDQKKDSQASFALFFQRRVISSKVFPFVSGTIFHTNRAASTQITP